MVVAVIAMGVMKVALHEVVGVVTVRNRQVAAAPTVDVVARVRPAVVVGGAPVGVAFVDLDHVLVDVVPVGMMEVAVMEVVDMVAVPHPRVAAALAVFVVVVGVDVMRM